MEIQSSNLKRKCLLLSGISAPLEIVMRLPSSQRPMSQMPSTVLLSRKPIYETASTAVQAKNLVFQEGRFRAEKREDLGLQQVLSPAFTTLTLETLST